MRQKIYYALQKRINIEKEERIERLLEAKEKIKLGGGEKRIVNITEVSAAEKLEEFRKEEEGFIESSFDTIAAYKENAAMMHYKAEEGKSNYDLKKEGMFLIDSGGQYLDGTTDITRIIALGDITQEEKRDFTLTLKGHINLIDARFLYGATGSNLDVLARYPLWREGIDYKSGTGHGIGFLLKVHEGPIEFLLFPIMLDWKRAW